MKILFIDHDPHISGSTKSLIDIINRIKKDDNIIYVLTAKSIQCATIVFGSNVNIIHCPISFYLNVHFSADSNVSSKKYIRTFVGFILRFTAGIIYSVIIYYKNKYDLIFVNEYVTIQLAFYSSVMRVPIVCMVRSQIINGAVGFRRSIIFLLLRKLTRRIIAISNLEASQFKWKNGIVSIMEYPSVENKEIVIKDHEKINVINLGGISTLKGTDLYIHLAKSCGSSGVKFKLAGSIDKNERKTLALEEVVEYLGFIDILDETLNDFDILVSTITQTHFSKPILEAWAHGLVVLAPDLPHITEYVQDGINGYIYKANDTIDLINKFKYVINDRKSWKSIRNNATNTLNSKFNKIVNIETIARQIYESR